MSFLDYLCDVTEVTPLDGYKLRVVCSDGARGVFDMSQYLDKGDFRALRNQSVSQGVRLVAGAPHVAERYGHRPERVRSDMIVD
ncbi:DUF2442 domain-containing protein [Bifidobacterium parmae]|uniref:Uncharacterized protein n=1 Tax=Bifidobacterium parmae TaxID=361854 RepID=A0A2N5J5F3_9BIFI|nr:DUF2442 domain-containing protein [Bifidobacterium parmae]PLS29417.1 hypothetical protein Uis4E_0291 [Bifidobacterium parmae]